MKIKKGIRFNLIKLKGVKEDLRIRMRVSYSGKRLSFPLSSRMNLDKWDDTSEIALPRYEDKFGNTSKDINREIEEFRSSMEKVFAKYELVEERIPSIEELKRDFNELIGKSHVKQLSSTPSNINEIAEIYLLENRGVWAPGTYRKVKTILGHLKKFDQNLNINDFTIDVFKKYVHFLLYKQGLQNSTVITNTKNIKWLMNWATKNKYNTNLDYLNFKAKLKTVDTKVIFLTWDELMAVYNLNIPESKQYLDRVRDVFCFQCFTSLRYSDVYNLKKNDIKEDYIEVVTQKTQDSLLVDLNDYSRSILKKYSAVKIPGNKALPVISNQKMNDYLKELAALAGINSDITITYFVGNERVEQTIPKSELITTHCGRRTFICNALSLGIPPHVVMKWTGHSDYRAMKPYIDVADNTRLKQMNKFNVDDF